LNVKAQMDEEEIIEILVEYIWTNKDKMVANTDYERCLLLLIELKDKVEKTIYKKWKGLE